MKRLTLPSWAWGLVAFLLLLTVALLGYKIGNYRVFQALGEQESAYRILTEKHDDMIRQNEQLRAGRTSDERRLQVLHRALEHLRDMLHIREGQLQETRESVDLYRELMGSGPHKEIKIHSLKLVQDDVSGSWKYRLVLFQRRGEAKTQGHYDFLFHGQTQGQATRYRLSELTQAEESHAFSFRYLERLSGGFIFPKDFDVRRLEVELHSKGVSKPTLQSFDWHSLVSADY